MNPLEFTPLVAARDFPEHDRQLRRLRQEGKAWSPLPGIFTIMEDSPELRIAAAHLWAPNHVLCGTAAARITWWPEAPVELVTLTGSRKRTTTSWVRVVQGKIDPDWVTWVHDRPVARPALSAIQAAAEIGGEALDNALRAGVTLARLHEAFAAFPKQAGKAQVAQLLRDSRDEPWSELERTAHKLLRQARITGWRTNHRFTVRGEVFYLDIAFPGSRLVVELDGYRFHSGREAFERDRIRQNLLVAAGWRVLRFTSRTVEDMPRLVHELLRAPAAAC